jgi:hypothetical protein
MTTRSSIEEFQGQNTIRNSEPSERRQYARLALVLHSDRDHPLRINNVFVDRVGRTYHHET